MRGTALSRYDHFSGDNLWLIHGEVEGARIPESGHELELGSEMETEHVGLLEWVSDQLLGVAAQDGRINF